MYVYMMTMPASQSKIYLIINSANDRKSLEVLFKCDTNIYVQKMPLFMASEKWP